jgi:hypothetical protein
MWNDKAEAQRLLQVRNDAEKKPHFNLALARVFGSVLEPGVWTLGLSAWHCGCLDNFAKKRPRWCGALLKDALVRALMYV